MVAKVHMVLFSVLGIPGAFGQLPWLSGNIDKAHENLIQKVMLYELTPHRTMRTVDSAAVDASGHFSFNTSPNDHTAIYQLAIKYGRPFRFMAGYTGQYRLTTTAFDIYLGKAKLEGVPINDLFNELTSLESALEQEKEKTTGSYGDIDPFDPQYNTRTGRLREAYFDKVVENNRQIKALQVRYQHLSDAKALCGYFIIPVKSDLPETDRLFDSNRSYQHHHFFDGMDFDNPLTVHLPGLYDRLDEYLQTLIDNSTKEGMMRGADKLMSWVKGTNGHEAVATYLVKHFDRMNEEEVVQHVKDRYLGENCEISSPYLTDMVRVRIAAKAPEITLADRKGDLVSLHRQAGQKATVVMFWGTWCPHCMDNLPALLKLQAEHGTKGLHVYAIAVGSDKTDWERTTDRQQRGWTDVMDGAGAESQVLGHYAIKGTPTYFLLDSTLEVRLRTSEITELTEAALKLLR